MPCVLHFSLVILSTYFWALTPHKHPLHPGQAVVIDDLDHLNYTQNKKGQVWLTRPYTNC
jgi:hypothetical protein